MNPKKEGNISFDSFEQKLLIQEQLDVEKYEAILERSVSKQTRQNNSVDFSRLEDSICSRNWVHLLERSPFWVISDDSQIIF